MIKWGAWLASRSVHEVCMYIYGHIDISKINELSDGSLKTLYCKH